MKGEDAAVSAYMRRIARYDVMSHEELVAAYARMPHSRNEVVTRNLQLVVSFAKKYRRLPCYMDLIQEGNIGLFRAVDNFDPSRGFAFSTYAKWWIRNHILNYLQKSAQAVYVPPNKRSSVPPPISLDATVGESEVPFLESFASEMSSPDRGVLAASLLDPLTGRERDVIALRYGLHPDGDHGQQEIGDMFSFSRQRIQQIEVEALGKLQRATLARTRRGA